MGVRGVDTGELVLDDVRVSATNVVGEVGGFRLAMLGLNSMRHGLVIRSGASDAMKSGADFLKLRRFARVGASHFSSSQRSPMEWSARLTRSSTA